MLEQEIPSPIREIMRIGGELVNQYVELVRSDLSTEQKARASVVYIGKEYYLTFSGELLESVSEEPVYKACIYSFPLQSEPMLIISKDTYYPKAKGFDATYWLDVVKKAHADLWMAINIVSIIGKSSISPMARRFADAVDMPFTSRRQPFKATVAPSPTLGMLTSQIIEETDSIFYHVWCTQRIKEEPFTSFADNILGCGVLIKEGKPQDTLQILMPPQITDFSKTIEVVSSQGTFSVNSEINQEVGLNLGKLRNALKDVRKQLEEKYPVEKET